MSDIRAPDVKEQAKQDYSTEKEWEFQFARDRQATFLQAQSRAIAELRNLTLRHRWTNSKI